MTISALPTPPSRNDPSTFATRADALLGALPAFVTETNAVVITCNAAKDSSDAAISAGVANAAANATTATTQAGIAAAKAGEANASAVAAAAAVASIAGGPVASINGLTGVVTIDQAGIFLIATSQNVSAKSEYLVDTSAAPVTLTLPAIPAQGDSMQFSDAKGTWATNNMTLNRNGHNILDLYGTSTAEDLTCDMNGLEFSIFYDAPNWRLV